MSPPSETISVEPDCGDVVDRARDLVAVAGRFAAGNATVAEVQAAAGAVSDAIADVRTAGPDARAYLDEAGQALQQVEDALTARPVDTQALRAATRDLTGALGDAANVCVSDSREAPAS